MKFSIGGFLLSFKFVAGTLFQTVEEERALMIQRLPDESKMPEPNHHGGTTQAKLCEELCDNEEDGTIQAKICDVLCDFVTIGESCGPGMCEDPEKTPHCVSVLGKDLCLNTLAASAIIIDSEKGTACGTCM